MSLETRVAPENPAKVDELALEGGAGVGDKAPELSAH